MSRAVLVLDSEFQRRKAADWVWAAPPGSRVEFKGPKRSLDQNSLMWALLTDIAVHMRKAAGLEYSTEDWKHVFLHGWGREVRFLPALDGKGVVPVPQSSSDLSREEMTDFIEYILKEGAERGVTFHNPSESSSEPSPPADDAGSGGSSSLAVSAADLTAAADPAGDLEAPPPASELPADTFKPGDRMLMEECIDNMLRDAFSEPAIDRPAKVDRMRDIFLGELPGQEKFVRLVHETARRVIGKQVERARASEYLKSKLPPKEMVG